VDIPTRSHTLLARNAAPLIGARANSVQVARNLGLYDQLDCEGWNTRNWELFSRLHAETVVGGGTMTEGNANHVAWAQAFIEENPESMIEAHPIRIGAGDWTAAVGTFPSVGSMCTVARWVNRQIAEEYLFSG
jgi:hypothetical protein